MEDCRKVKQTCYIGETKSMAGIFLSRKIAESKKFYEHLSLTEYTDFKAAEEVFLKKYSDVVGEIIHLNELYQVRDKAMYSVFYTPLCIGITDSYEFEKNLKIILGAYKGPLWVSHYLEYEDAVEDIQKKLFEKGISKNIRLHTAIYYPEQENWCQ